MELSTRLSTIAQFVPKGSTVVDVGTDHGYIPIYLRKNNYCDFCIASDINKGPLDKANTHIAKYCATNIDVRQASGLCGVKPGEVDTIIIAGMGGCLIIDILRNSPEVVKGARTLILQPQTEVDNVRKSIHAMGFKIDEEAFIEEDGKYYTIIVCSVGCETYANEYEYKYGKYLIDHKPQLFVEWMQRKQQTFDKIYAQLATVAGAHIEARKKELDDEYALYKEVVKCLL
ncbi:MAG: tRNA (adenine(22)-N(1))-methyltransferase TrmK [Cellulosilyticaceae bacterium]